ncbi:MAG: CDP-diacylglycerol--serine O-phosphatidyltransferase [Myxococcaceae bacterium]|nr:CDP-diacylglycerol--serine O-phosphatidyltransferase [Myxococcaceae bacterium]MCI0668997.1 CDP-diacylglycerol--serine O-phosphatidyltransferase [Myxococcaceae bacterium]
MKPHKLMFILPNLFTVSSIFCGFYALTRCVGDATPLALYQAALALLFSNFFDTFDGRVARLTRTQSQFGMELDSLADVVAFGVAPAVLVYRWALEPLGLLGVFIAFAFVACGALRLARFNVLARHVVTEGGTGAFFVGLPIPLAAVALNSLVIAHHVIRGEALADSARAPVAVITVLLSLLMVSTVRYRTFKAVRLSPRSALLLMAVLAAGGVIAARAHPALALVGYAGGYVVFGLLESLFLLRRTALSQLDEALLDSAGETEEEDSDAQHTAREQGLS